MALVTEFSDALHQFVFFGCAKLAIWQACAKMFVKRTKGIMNKTPDGKKLWALIKSTQIGMLTSLNANGKLNSRPMAMAQTTFDGFLWFFTEAACSKVDEVHHHSQVSVNFVDAEKNRFVTISGKAQIVHDRAKARELWRPFLRAWFPQGVDSPEIALIRVKVETAEYWESASSQAVNVSLTIETPAVKSPKNEKLTISQ